MSRKRFIKLLMSAGVQRNKAVKVTEHCLSNNISYKECWVLIASKRMEKSIIDLARAVKSCAEHINNLGEAFYKMRR